MSLFFLFLFLVSVCSFYVVWSFYYILYNSLRIRNISLYFVFFFVFLPPLPFFLLVDVVDFGSACACVSLFADSLNECTHRACACVRDGWMSSLMLQFASTHSRNLLPHSFIYLEMYIIRPCVVCLSHTSLPHHHRGRCCCHCCRHRY